jgi:hypothetical protein
MFHGLLIMHCQGQHEMCWLVMNTPCTMEDEFDAAHSFHPPWKPSTGGADIAFDIQFPKHRVAASHNGWS